MFIQQIFNGRAQRERPWNFPQQGPRVPRRGEPAGQPPASKTQSDETGVLSEQFQLYCHKLLVYKGKQGFCGLTGSTIR